MPNDRIQKNIEQFVNATSHTQEEPLKELAVEFAVMGDYSNSYDIVLDSARKLYQQFEDAFSHKKTVNPQYAATQALRQIGARAVDYDYFHGTRAFMAVHETMHPGPY